MTLVTIDLGDVAGGHHPDDYVTIRAEAFREAVGGGVTSTAEVKIPLVSGVGQAEVEPGPVVVAFRCQAVADTREKRGVVPESGQVGIEEVIGGAFEYAPPVVNHGLDLIEGARDEALGQVAGAVDGAISDWSGLVQRALSMGRRNARAIRDLAAQSPSNSDISDVVAGITGQLATKADKGEIAGQLATKADKSEVAGITGQLATKADKTEVADVTAFSLRALSMGRKNTKTIRDLASRVADKAEVANLTSLTLSALSMGRKNTTAIKNTAQAVADLEGRIPDVEPGIPIPPGGIPGQLIMLTESGWAWTWADRHPATYHDKY